MPCLAAFQKCGNCAPRRQVAAVSAPNRVDCLPVESMDSGHLGAETNCHLHLERVLVIRPDVAIEDLFKPEHKRMFIIVQNSGSVTPVLAWLFG